MFSKLALKNAAKSFRDYTVYFLTVLFGVCLFYVFNSIDSQTAMLKLSESQQSTVKVLLETMDYISVFIAVVLGFLVVYANGFLMKRRKKELGVYLTLGMPKGKISAIVVSETFLIGLISLGAGLVLGVFASQGMSVVTARLFEADMTEFRFVFSRSACVKTLVCFALIFCIVMLFNTISVSRLSLVELLNAGKKNETLRFGGRLWVSVAVFLVSAGCLVTAYALILQNGLQQGPRFTASILLGCAGTLLFFFSLSGFLLRITQANKKLYFKNLNMFVLRQFNSKINTNFVSVSVICLMLFLTIGALSSGIGVADALSKDLKDTTPYDVSFQYFYHADDAKRQIGNLAQHMKDDGIDLDRYVKGYAQINLYQLVDRDGHSANLDSLMLKGAYAALSDGDSESESPLTVVPLSDYNDAMKLQGKPALKLGDGTYAVSCDVDEIGAAYRDFLKSGGKFSFDGKELAPAETEVLSSGWKNAEGRYDTGTLIVPDSFLESFSLSPSAEVLNVRYREGADEAEFLKRLKSVYNADAMDKETVFRPYDYYNSKVELYERAAGDKALASYMTLYIGLIFLIAAAAVLALQQLSEASDNTARYALLRKLGAEEKMTEHALLTQIGLYFLLPLSLAVIHSVVGLRMVTNVLHMGGLDIRGSALIASLVILAVYGGYFLATYFGGRAMIREKDA